jgi:hypothetical protein
MIGRNLEPQKLMTTKRNLLRLRYIGNTCGIIEREIPEEITYEKEGS